VGQCPLSTIAGPLTIERNEHNPSTQPSACAKALG